MIEINLNNVEKLVLEDGKLRQALPDLQSFFDSWFIGRSTPGLRALASRAKIELLNAILPRHLEVLSVHLNDTVRVRPFDSNVVSNCESAIPEAMTCLKGLEDYSEIAIYRKGDQIKITAWR